MHSYLTSIQRWTSLPLKIFGKAFYGGLGAILSNSCNSLSTFERELMNVAELAYKKGIDFPVPNRRIFDILNQCLTISYFLYILLFVLIGLYLMYIIFPFPRI